MAGTFTTIPDGDIDPESPITTGLMTSMRNNQEAAVRTLFSDKTIVGNVGAGEDDLTSFTLPANTLNTDAQALRVTGWGVGNGVDNARVIIYFGATGAATVTGTTLSFWFAEAIIMRRAAASQDLYVVGDQIGPVEGRLFTNTPAEDLTAAVIIKFTGENLTDASNDAVVQHGMIVEFIP